jgi:hypothetical protein
MTRMVRIFYHRGEESSSGSFSSVKEVILELVKMLKTSRGEEYYGTRIKLYYTDNNETITEFTFDKNIYYWLLK